MPTRGGLRTRRLGTHQAELYAAEAMTIAEAGRRWSRIRDAQRYLDDLIDGEWFTSRWPDLLGCTVERRGSGSVWSTCQRLDTDGADDRPTEGVILVADGALTQPVMLHELAHLLVPPDAGHGPVFAGVLLSLVRHEMGFFAYAEFLHALRLSDTFSGLQP
jgi:putative metallohydrolase (TIGR04338 family)